MTMSYRPLSSAMQNAPRYVGVARPGPDGRLQPPLRGVAGELDQRPDRRAGATLGGVAVRLAAVEGGPGDVQVRPANPLGDELAQEHPGDQHPTIALGRQVNQI